LPALPLLGVLVEFGPDLGGPDEAGHAARATSMASARA
jgi:hypothetical protein